MQQRTLYTASGRARAALFFVTTADAFLIENLLIALLVGADDIHSLFLFALQIPHIFAILLGCTVAAYYRSARLMLGFLFGAYLLAFICDVIAFVIHCILAYAADSQQERRNEVVYLIVIFTLCIVDALGVHFGDRLRDSLEQERRCLESLARRPEPS